MSYDFDLSASGDAIPSPPAASRGWGGARRGAGKKPQGYEKPEEVVEYDKAKARNELAKAQLNELDLKIKSGEYVSRAAVRQAAATAMAVLAQTARSISDNLERQGIPPEVCAKVDEAITEALADTGRDLQLMGGE